MCNPREPCDRRHGPHSTRSPKLVSLTYLAGRSCPMKSVVEAEMEFVGRVVPPRHSGPPAGLSKPSQTDNSLAFRAVRNPTAASWLRDRISRVPGGAANLPAEVRRHGEAA